MYWIAVLLAMWPGAGIAQEREREGPERHPDRMEESVRRAPRRGFETDQAPGLRRMANPRRTVRLGALTKAERQPAIRKPGLTPVGVARAVPADALAQGEWSVTPEGTRVWRLQLQSAEAESVRVRFADFHVGAGKVWLFGAAGSDGVGPYSGDGLFGDGAFWSDLVGSDTVTVAYEPEATDSTTAVPFRVEELSHRYATTAAGKRAADEPAAVRAAAAATCAVDLSCHPNYAEPAAAVALMLFESGGKSYQCSGALLNSATDPVLPYFLTAMLDNSCILPKIHASCLWGR